MVGVQDIPQIDSRTREMLFQEMRKSLNDKGFSVEKDDGEILSALVVLYSHMLAGTVKRLNRTPEKHRAAFLNLAHTSPRPAWPSCGIVVFEVAGGYDNPVEISVGTRVTTDDREQPISFKLIANLTALPANITDVYWCDAARGRYGSSQILSRLYPWDGAYTREIAYKADFIFENIFYNNDEATMFVDAFAGDCPISLSGLISASRWSISPWPQDEAEPFSLSLSEDSDGGLRLKSPELIADAQHVRIRMELIDPEYAELCVSGMYLMQPDGSALPDTVLTNERGLEASGFYPFGASLRAFEECGIFCDRALSQKSAEITLRFELRLEVFEEWPVVPPEAVDYKWIMRKPLPKPKLEVYEAFAKTVRLDYWDGTTYREICDINGAVLNFTRENLNAELTFTCPDDIAPCEYYGRTGYYLRLSCGECDELYNLPRRVYTPYLSGLRFSYDHTVKYYPAQIVSESFGLQTELETQDRVKLFKNPKPGKTLLLGFDRLEWKCRIKMYISIDNATPEGNENQKLKARIYNGQDIDFLPSNDFTRALTRSDGLWLDIPENARPATLFGKERYWVELSVDHDDPPVISGIFLNAQMAVNYNRYNESFSYIHLKNNRITLTHKNIARAWVYVRSITEDDMKLWCEYKETDGKFRESFYKLDAASGLITFPDDIIGRSISDDALDLIRVTYDATDGEAANLPANTITRMEEDIPFIQSVRNPFAIANGADSESGAELAVRKQHALYNGGRIVSKRDFELFAIDNCPLVSDAKCTYDENDKAVVLAVRMAKRGQEYTLEKVKRDLKKHFSSLIREGLDLDIVLWEDAP